jgi:hypothetical protein
MEVALKKILLVSNRLDALSILPWADLGSGRMPSAQRRLDK